ncbi:MAG: PIG-L family deacetylase [bacterium]|nr:PIG-L family deacetylase [bacterium]
MAGDLLHLPEDWERALAVVAHPDDLEYGVAAAVARWTAAGKDVRYALVTSGEAGIAALAPEETGPLREAEQRASAAAVGVSDVEFLGFPDGCVMADLDLRRALAACIRRHRPEAVLSINYRDSFGGGSWNHVDHRNVGRALIDAVRDAANPWMFPELAANSLEAWGGVRFIAFGGSPEPTHAVDVTGHLEAGFASLAAHAVYLATLEGPMADPEAFLRPNAEADGERLGVRHAVSFEVVFA